MGRILNTIAVVGLATAGVACGSDAEQDSADVSQEPAEVSQDSAEVSQDSAEVSQEPAEVSQEPAEVSQDSVVVAQEPAEVSQESADAPRIVVTTNILGDVVAAAVGDAAQVEVIMPLGSSPHDFAPSARQAETMENADLLIVNGAGFEEGMLDVIANVADTGTAVFTVADHVDLLMFTGDDEHDHGDDGDDGDDGHDDHGHDDHGDDEHGDDEHDHGDDEHGDHGDDEHGDDEHGDDDKHDDGDHDNHAHGEGNDPHLWTDPTRIMAAVTALEPVVADLEGVDGDALSMSFDAYLAELAALDTAMESTLASLPVEQRVLVTNHHVFGYFADRFGFEVVGAIIPSLTTNAESSAAGIEGLADLMDAEGIRAIFGETTQSSQLAEVLADEVGGDVSVVELFGESLGDEGSGAETYIEMMQLNADLIAAALAS